MLPRLDFTSQFSLSFLELLWVTGDTGHVVVPVTFIFMHLIYVHVLCVKRGRICFGSQFEEGHGGGYISAGQEAERLGLEAGLGDLVQNKQLCASHCLSISFNSPTIFPGSSLREIKNPGLV